MSGIFDRFPSLERAEAFFCDVQTRFKLGGSVYPTYEAFCQDPSNVFPGTQEPCYPFELHPPIVWIDRVEFGKCIFTQIMAEYTIAAADDPIKEAERAVENAVRAVVTLFGGAWAGT